ncbi:MAG TPA: DUF4160 domain-containing protein [Thermoanaerobaculia bacterium]
MSGGRATLEAGQETWPGTTPMSKLLLKGKLPRRAERLVREWRQEFRRELEENWNLARAHEPLKTIPPLE